jgi:hypothetical protein
MKPVNIKPLVLLMLFLTTQGMLHAAPPPNKKPVAQVKKAVTPVKKAPVTFTQPINVKRDMNLGDVDYNYYITQVGIPKEKLNALIKEGLAPC